MLTENLNKPWGCVARLSAFTFPSHMQSIFGWTLCYFCASKNFLCKWRYKICRCYIRSLQKEKQMFQCIFTLRSCFFFLTLPLSFCVSSWPSSLPFFTFGHAEVCDGVQSGAQGMADHIRPSGSACPAELSLKPDCKTTLVSVEQHYTGQSS